MRRAKRGVTVVEMLVALGLFGLMLAVLFFIFRTGANAWSKGTTEARMLSTIQVVSARVTRVVERTSAFSLTVDSANKGMACLSAIDGSGYFQYHASTGLPWWQDYLIFHYDSTRKTLNHRSISVLGTPQEQTATTFERAFGRPLAGELSGGIPVARDIEDARFERTADDQVILEIDMQSTRYQHDGPQTLTSRSVIKLRN